MEFATGALGTLLPKLGQLLQDEYNLQNGVKKDIEFVTRELESIRGAFRDVGEVPQEQLKEAVKIWARDVRELSYDMEDIVDTFLVRVQGSEPPSKKEHQKIHQEDDRYYEQGQDSPRDWPRDQGHQGACQGRGRAT